MATNYSTTVEMFRTDIPIRVATQYQVYGALANKEIENWEHKMYAPGVRYNIGKESYPHIGNSIVSKPAPYEQDFVTLVMNEDADFSASTRQFTSFSRSVEMTNWGAQVLIPTTKAIVTNEEKKQAITLVTKPFRTPQDYYSKRGNGSFIEGAALWDATKMITDLQLNSDYLCAVINTKSNQEMTTSLKNNFSPKIRENALFGQIGSLAQVDVVASPHNQKLPSLPSATFAQGGPGQELEIVSVTTDNFNGGTNNRVTAVTLGGLPNNLGKLPVGARIAFSNTKLLSKLSKMVKDYHFVACNSVEAQVSGTGTVVFTLAEPIVTGTSELAQCDVAPVKNDKVYMYPVMGTNNILNDYGLFAAYPRLEDIEGAVNTATSGTSDKKALTLQKQTKQEFYYLQQGEITGRSNKYRIDRMMSSTSDVDGVVVILTAGG